MIFKNNKTFDVLKWSLIVFIPALVELYCGLAKIFGWGYSEIIRATVDQISLFIGVVLGWSNVQYYKQYPKTDETAYTIDGMDVEEQNEQGGQG